MAAPVIETARLRLRSWRDGDVDAWAQLNADPRVMEFFPSTYDRARSLETAARLREALERDGYGWWAVSVKDGIDFAGILALQNVPFEAAFTPALEVGWRFARDAWGKGYATEGAAALLDFAFTTLHKQEVVAMTSTLNVRSQRVMQRLGMVRDPRDDFDHPRVEPDSPLRRHVLYRIAASHRQVP